MTSYTLMLDPCLTGSYGRKCRRRVTSGSRRSFTKVKISGPAELEVKVDSRRVEFTVAPTNHHFSSNVKANVLNDITANRPAIQWNDLKNKWSHLKSIPFENVASRPQIDVLIESDRPVFYHVL